MTCITRVYVHGDVMDSYYDDTFLAESMILWNIRNRANCACFVNGRMVHQGLIALEKCKELEQSYK